ncbi:MAG: radical SAM protein [Candidatus Nanoarchaeia archaeon]|jgi:radical SAM superfamily enzyme YgiQ (UPF0313 family)|nr:radical SAM protein [Candidatus Nanoarchaeia archaeon]|tara:strand:- start:39440 stop:40864 length:1425 start_codon:yes stop_codon:yes gene_type:complete
MKALLLFPQTETIYGLPNYPPLGLAYLSSILRKNDIDHDILDLRLYDNWKELLISKLKNDYVIAGMASTVFDHPSAKELASIIKEHRPKTKVIVGGAHPTLVKDKILKKDENFDFVLVGEGELTFSELCIALKENKKLDDIKGLIFRDDDKIIINESREYNNNLDELPFPEYEKFDLKKYHGDTTIKGILGRKTIFPMSTSRGCPYSCTFCSVPVFTGKLFRVRSPKNVVDEMKVLKEKYNVGTIDVLDDNFSMNLERAKQICRLIIKNKLNIKWSTPNGIRADRLDDELAMLMKKAGCSELAIGIESVDNEVLKKMKKGENIEAIERGISLLKKYDISIKGFFIIGSNGETKESVLKMLDFAKKHEFKTARFNMLIPYPGTEMASLIDENKYWTVDNPEEELVKYTHIADEVRSIYETPSLNSKDKIEAYNIIVKGWEDYELSKNWKKRFLLKLREYKIIYNLLKNLRNSLKN